MREVRRTLGTVVIAARAAQVVHDREVFAHVLEPERELGARFTLVGALLLVAAAILVALVERVCDREQ